MPKGDRVLVIGPAGVGDMAWFVGKAYRRLGWRVSVFDDRAFVGRGLPGRLGSIVQLLERNHQLTSRRRLLGEMVSKLARDAGHVLTIKGEYFLPEDVAAVSDQVPFVCWHPDHPMLDQEYATVAYYTRYFAKDRWTTRRLRGMGFTNVDTLPHAGDPYVLSGPEPSRQEWAMSVVGGMYPYRQHWILRAAELGIGVRVWGGRIPRAPIGIECTSVRALGQQQGAAFRSGLFTLNTHHPHDVAGANQRLFDAAAASVAQITEMLPDSARHFAPGSEIRTFDCPAEFDEAMRELQSDVSLRRQLAKASHGRLLAEHTYEHRIQSLLSSI